MSAPSCPAGMRGRRVACAAHGGSERGQDSGVGATKIVQCMMLVSKGLDWYTSVFRATPGTLPIRKCKPSV